MKWHPSQVGGRFPWEIASTVYTSGDYEIIGTGSHGPGGKIVRTWTLKYKDQIIGTPTRLAEAKRDAEAHAQARE